VRWPFDSALGSVVSYGGAVSYRGGGAAINAPRPRD